MTQDEFNALPLEARQFIINEQGCLSCGKSRDLQYLYNKYLLMQKESYYTLRNGAIPFQNEKGEGGILYPIHPSDNDNTVKEKLKTAQKVFKIAPDKFSVFNKEEIEKFLKEKKQNEPNL